MENMKHYLRPFVLWGLMLVCVGCSLISRPEVVADAGEDFSTIVGREVRFDASKSIINDAKSVNYRWEISGENLTGEQVDYVFADAGEYEVQLVLTVDGVEFTDTVRVFVAETNLFVNGDFSLIDLETDYPVGWEPQTYTTEGVPFVVVDADDAFVGRNYVGVTINATADRGQWSQRLDDLEPGMYRVAGRYRVDRAITPENRVHVRLLRLTRKWDKVFNDTHFYLAQDTGGEWFYFEADFEITPEVEITYLEFQLFFAVGTVYYDDLMLMKLP